MDQRKRFQDAPCFSLLQSWTLPGSCISHAGGVMEREEEGGGGRRREEEGGGGRRREDGGGIQLHTARI